MIEEPEDLGKYYKTGLSGVIFIKETHCERLFLAHKGSPGISRTSSLQEPQLLTFLHITAAPNR